MFVIGGARGELSTAGTAPRPHAGSPTCRAPTGGALESRVLHYCGAGDCDYVWMGDVWVGVAACGSYYRGGDCSRGCDSDFSGSAAKCAEVWAEESYLALGNL